MADVCCSFLASAGKRQQQLSLYYRLYVWVDVVGDDVSALVEHTHIHMYTPI